MSLATVMAVGAHQRPGVGPEPGRADRLHLPREPAAHPHRRAERDPRPDADGHRRLAQDPRRARPRPSTSVEPVDGRTLPRGALTVDLEGVRFAYRTGDEVLRGIDLHLPAGASVAVVGETGSGKTTIAKLLCRLADPTEGVVRVGGVDLRDGGARVSPGRGPDGAAGRVPVRHHARRERPGRATRGERRGRARRLHHPRARPAGSTTSRAASRRRSASVARTSRSASASSSRSPGPSSATRAC